VPREAYCGRLQGFVFKLDARGLGYYKDRPYQAVTEESQASVPPFTYRDMDDSVAVIIQVSKSALHYM
jgi:hypothetical protein